MSVLRTPTKASALPEFALRLPLRRQQSPTPIFGQRNSRFIQFFPIPKLTSHLPLRLIQRLAVVRIGAAADFIAATELHFDEPIRIGKSLSRQPGNVGVTSLKNCLSLFECSNAAGGDNWRCESGGVHRVFDP